MSQKKSRHFNQFRRGNMKSLEDVQRAMAEQPPQQAVTTQVSAMNTIDGFTFNMATVIGIDINERDYQPGKPGRSAKLIIVGPYVREFTDKAADELYNFYLAISGQARIQTT